MKNLTLIFLLSISFCSAQKSIENTTQKILGKWSFQQFEEAKKIDKIVTVTLTEFVENVDFIFNRDSTLDVNYSESKREMYFYKVLKGNLIEIIPQDLENYNPRIPDQFEIYFSKNLSSIFLQRRNKPHHGITLNR